MNEMNQNSHKLNLLNFTDGNTHPFGNQQGKATFRRLSDYIDSHPAVFIFGISLEGIEVTDASFPRESVISIAKFYRGSKGIYLENFKNRDILDTWNYAAVAKLQPIVSWDKNKYEILGSSLTNSSKGLVDYVLTKGNVLVSQVASDLGISVPNASTKLKKLFMDGYIMRSEETAESGGIEFNYHAIK